MRRQKSKKCTFRFSKLHFSFCRLYGGSCDELDYYLDAWKYIIDHIISGQITESTLDSWLEYFDECYYQEETTIAE